jgi:hypothetical protein
VQPEVSFSCFDVRRESVRREGEGVRREGEGVRREGEGVRREAGKNPPHSFHFVGGAELGIYLS